MRIGTFNTAVQIAKSPTTPSLPRSNFFVALETAIGTNTKTNNMKSDKAATFDVAQLIDVFQSDLPADFIQELKSVEVTTIQELLTLIMNKDPDFQKMLEIIDEKIVGLINESKNLNSTSFNHLGNEHHNEYSVHNKLDNNQVLFTPNKKHQVIALSVPDTVKENENVIAFNEDQQSIPIPEEPDKVPSELVLEEQDKDPNPLLEEQKNGVPTIPFNIDAKDIVALIKEQHAKDSSVSIMVEQDKGFSKTEMQENDQSTDLIEKTIHLLTKISQLESQKLLQLTNQELVSIMNTVKKIQFGARTIQENTTIINKMEKLDTVVEELFNRLKIAENDSRIRDLSSIVESVISKENTQKNNSLLLPNQQMNLVKIIPAPPNKEISLMPVQSQEPTPKIEQYTLHVEAKPNQEQKASELIKAFSNILAKSQLSQTPGSTRLLIKLYPEHLGALRVELLQKEGVMIARMIVSTSTAKDLLDSQLHSLKHTFNQQNIQVDKIDVHFSQNDLQKYMDRNARDEGQNSEEKNSPEQKNKEKDDTLDFAEALNTILFETEV
ncbi:flagellar hook-length control protein FliK [Bacillus sp. FSL K6-3431]|uniref:flagellar hook-length control protein FliK n=1 Tax=Bacillus sp. FSL K6-3431 TaxID=2921500 RepID=UPI0030F9794F